MRLKHKALLAVVLSLGLGAATAAVAFGQDTTATKKMEKKKKKGEKGGKKDPTKGS